VCVCVCHSGRRRAAIERRGLGSLGMYIHTCLRPNRLSMTLLSPFQVSRSWGSSRLTTPTLSQVWRSSATTKVRARVYRELYMEIRRGVSVGVATWMCIARCGYMGACLWVWLHGCSLWLWICKTAWQHYITVNNISLKIRGSCGLCWSYAHLKSSLWSIPEYPNRIAGRTMQTCGDVPGSQLQKGSYQMLINKWLPFCCGWQTLCLQSAFLLYLWG
jgi:hypothetical protein